MRKSTWSMRRTLLSLLVFTSLATAASAAPATRKRTAKTMDQVVDRITTNENRLYDQISQVLAAGGDVHPESETGQGPGPGARRATNTSWDARTSPRV